MTPSALTPAARRTTKKSPPDRAGHRTGLRREVSPRAPRRVSGPLGGLTREKPLREQPLRPSSRTAPWVRPGAAPPTAAPGRFRWLARPAAYVQALPDHALLDRAIRGRVWIPLLGMLLAGIVAMQVEVLKLNAGIGRTLERGTALQSQNELLRASVAKLADEQRIERLAAAMGMVMPAPQNEKFLTTGAATTQRALTSIRAPDPTRFTALLPSAATIAALAAGASTATATATPAGGATVSAPSTTSTAPATTGVPTSTGSSTPAGGAPATTTSTPVAPAGTATPSTPVSGSTQPVAPTSTQATPPATASGGVTPTGG
jgi:hypothetical protein